MTHTVLSSAPFYELVQPEPGVLWVKVRGDGGQAEIDAIFAAFQPALEANAPARLLFDGSELGEIDLAARWNLAQRMKKNRKFIALSVVAGLGPRLWVVLRILQRVSGRDDLILVDDPEEARRITLEPDRAAG